MDTTTTGAQRRPTRAHRPTFGQWLTTGLNARGRGPDLAGGLATASGVPRERVTEWVLNLTAPDEAECAAIGEHLGLPLSAVRTALQDRHRPLRETEAVAL